MTNWEKEVFVGENIWKEKPKKWANNRNSVISNKGFELFSKKREDTRIKRKRTYKILVCIRMWK